MRRRSGSVFDLALLLAAALSTASCTRARAADRTPVAPAQPKLVRRAIVVTIDGLMPEAYTSPDTHGLQIPTFRQIMRDGAWAAAVTTVMPAVTYPAHATMVTGVPPAVHGVVSNRALDPLEKNQGGWRWYAEDIKARTLWQAVEARGGTAALIQWPVTVGARARFLVPELWRANTMEDQKLIRAVSTPGLLDAVLADAPHLWERHAGEGFDDRGVVDIAVHLLETSPPDLMLLHLPSVDSAEHDHGPWSEQARVAIEEADRQVARLIAVCRERELWPDMALFVVSDHGFLPSHTELRPGALFRERGLIEVDAAGKPTKWRVALQANGGTAYLYLADPADAAAAALVREILAPHVAPAAGASIRRLLEPEDIRRLGGDPAAFLALEGQDGFVFQEGVAGPWQKHAKSLGHHGWAPDRPAMNASFLAYGPGVRKVALGTIPLTAIAPTVAAWLGVELAAAVERPLGVFTPAGVP